MTARLTLHTFPLLPKNCLGMLHVIMMIILLRPCGNFVWIKSIVVSNSRMIYIKFYIDWNVPVQRGRSSPSKGATDGHICLSPVVKMCPHFVIHQLNLKHGMKDGGCKRDFRSTYLFWILFLRWKKNQKWTNFAAFSICMYCSISDRLYIR